MAAELGDARVGRRAVLPSATQSLPRIADQKRVDQRLDLGPVDRDQAFQPVVGQRLSADAW